MLILTKVMLVLALVLGGTGATVAAAQSSLPGDALYPIKRFTEEVRVGTTADPQAQLGLHLELAEARTRELAQLAQQNRSIPEDVPVQLETQLQAALQIAAQLGEPQLLAALDQIQAHVETQTRTMAQARESAPDSIGLQQANRVLNQAQQMAQLGLSDPQLFRSRFGQGRPDHAPMPPVMTPQSTRTITPQPSRTPQPYRTPSATCTPARTPLGAPTEMGLHTPMSTPQGNTYGPGLQPSVTPVGDGNGTGSGGTPNTPVGAHTPEPQGTAEPQGPGEPQSTPHGANGSQATPQGKGGSGSVR